MKVVGYSLSLCVRDIISGLVKLEDVDHIVASTLALDEADWTYLVDSYSSMYWSADPVQAASIVQALRSQDRIRQPRIDNPHYRRELNDGCWQPAPGASVNVSPASPACVH